MIRSAPVRLAAIRAAGALCLAAMACSAAAAAPPGQALVIGESAYSSLPALSSCAMSARSVAAALRGLGFAVEEQVDAPSAAIFAGIAALTRHLQAQPDAPAFVYVCSYVTAFDNRPFLLPVSASIRRPADVLTEGLLEKSLIDAVAKNTKGPGVIAVDAIPAPNASSSLSLDRLTADLPAKLGLIAVQDVARPSQPTHFAVTLVGALRGEVHSATLLSDLKTRLAKLPNTQVAALHVPSEGQALATGPAAPAPAAGASAAAPATAAPPPATQPPPSAASTSGSLPDQDQFTAGQRRAVQHALAKLGYYHAPVDGVFGPLTTAAIRDWQQQASVPVTGHLTAAEANRLVGG